MKSTVNNKKGKNLTDINILKGIAILLVVLGHIHEGNGPILWQYLRKIIYSFHMPIFFIVSGFLYSLKSSSNTIKYKQLVNKILPRFAVPFLSFTIIILLYKLGIAAFLGESYLKYPVNLNSILQHFLNPSGGFATLLWFLYALFIIKTIYPLLKNFFKNDFLLLFILLIINFIDLPSIFVLNLVFRYFPFYILGTILFEFKFRRHFKSNIFPIYGLISAVLFTVFFVFFRDYPLVYFLLGAFGTYFVWNISFIFIRLRLIGMEFFGKISLDIYLWHTTVIGAMGIILNLLDITSFWIYTGVIFISTILLLVLLTGLINKSRFLSNTLYGRERVI